MKPFKFHEFLVIVALISYPVFGLTLDTNKIDVAILDFEGDATLSEKSSLLNQLYSELVGKKPFRVSERNQINTILREQGIQNSGCTTDSNIVEIGHLLNVQLLFIGTVNHGSGFYSIGIKVIDVTTGEIKANISNIFQNSSFPVIVNKEFPLMVKEINRKLLSNISVNTIESDSIDQIRCFADSFFNAIDKSQYGIAYSLFDTIDQKRMGYGNFSERIEGFKRGQYELPDYDTHKFQTIVKTPDTSLNNKLQYTYRLKGKTGQNIYVVYRKRIIPDIYLLRDRINYELEDLSDNDYKSIAEQLGGGIDEKDKILLKAELRKKELIKRLNTGNFPTKIDSTQKVFLKEHNGKLSILACAEYYCILDSLTQQYRSKLRKFLKIDNISNLTPVQTGSGYFKATTKFQVKNNSLDTIYASVLINNIGDHSIDYIKLYFDGCVRNSLYLHRLKPGVDTIVNCEVVSGFEDVKELFNDLGITYIPKAKPDLEDLRKRLFGKTNDSFNDIKTVPIGYSLDSMLVSRGPIADEFRQKKKNIIPESWYPGMFVRPGISNSFLD